MKNQQKGFIAPLLLAIIALLALGGGTYYFVQKSKTPQAFVPTTATTTVTDSTVARAETVGWKTYTNYAYGFSVKLPTDNNVYACEQGQDGNLQIALANEKSYRILILENPSDANLIKSCNYDERAKYKNLFIGARQSNAGEYSTFVENWQKGYGDKKYAVVEEIKFAQHNALLKTKVESTNNNNPYKEMIIDGGKYFYSINLGNKSDYLEKILSTFEVVTAKDQLSNWQAFRSDALGIEMKYPYNYREEHDNSMVIIYPVPQPIEFGPQFGLSMKTVATNTSVDQYVDTYIDTSYMSVTERGNVTINDIQWVKIKYLDISGAGPEASYINYFTIKKGYIYSVSYGDGSNVVTDDFAKIVGTIKFIN